MPTTEPRSLSEHKKTCTKPSLGSNFGRAENKDHHRFLSFDNRVMTHCRSTQTSPWSLMNQTSIGTKIRLKSWLALASDALPWTNPRDPPQTPPDGSQLLNEIEETKNLRRSTSSNPQENYQNTTASSLFCKTANDQVISKSDDDSVINGWRHPIASHTLFRNPQRWFQIKL